MSGFKQPFAKPAAPLAQSSTKKVAKTSTKVSVVKAPTAVKTDERVKYTFGVLCCGDGYDCDGSRTGCPCCPSCGTTNAAEAVWKKIQTILKVRDISVKIVNRQLQPLGTSGGARGRYLLDCPKSLPESKVREILQSALDG